MSQTTVYIGYGLVGLVRSQVNCDERRIILIQGDDRGLRQNRRTTTDYNNLLEHFGYLPLRIVTRSSLVNEEDQQAVPTLLSNRTVPHFYGKGLFENRLLPPFHVAAVPVSIDADATARDLACQYLEFRCYCPPVANLSRMIAEAFNANYTNSLIVSEATVLSGMYLPERGRGERCGCGLREQLLRVLDCNSRLIRGVDPLALDVRYTGGNYFINDQDGQARADRLVFDLDPKLFLLLKSELTNQPAGGRDLANYRIGFTAPAVGPWGDLRECCEPIFIGFALPRRSRGSTPYLSGSVTIYPSRSPTSLFPHTGLIPEGEVYVVIDVVDTIYDYYLVARPELELVEHLVPSIRERANSISDSALVMATIMGVLNVAPPSVQSLVEDRTELQNDGLLARVTRFQAEPLFNGAAYYWLRSLSELAGLSLFEPQTIDPADLPN